MTWLTSDQLQQMSFKKIGRNVLISDKASIYDAEQIEIGDNTRIDDFCVISGNVTFGRNVHIAVFCNVTGGTTGITFDDFSGLACRCHVFTKTDDFSGLALTNPTVPDIFKNVKEAKIHIGKHCIVGTSSTIFPNVTMEEGSSLGAMSMLTKSTQPWSIYFGIPAKKIKNRKKDLLDKEKLYLNKA